MGWSAESGKTLSGSVEWTLKLLATSAELVGTSFSLRPLVLFQTCLQLANNLFRSYWGMAGEAQQLHKTHFFSKFD